jgi:hypothetical protein
MMGRFKELMWNLGTTATRNVHNNNTHTTTRTQQQHAHKQQQTHKRQHAHKQQRAHNTVTHEDNASVTYAQTSRILLSAATPRPGKRQRPLPFPSIPSTHMAQQQRDGCEMRERGRRAALWKRGAAAASSHAGRGKEGRERDGRRGGGGKISMGKERRRGERAKRGGGEGLQQYVGIEERGGLQRGPHVLLPRGEVEHSAREHPHVQPVLAEPDLQEFVHNNCRVSGGMAVTRRAPRE